jgi:hypothetical protein
MTPKITEEESQAYAELARAAKRLQQAQKQAELEKTTGTLPPVKRAINRLLNVFDKLVDLANEASRAMEELGELAEGESE